MLTTSPAATFQLEIQEPPKPKPEKYVREKKHSKDFEAFAQRASYEPPPATPDETQFRHSAWQVKRAAVMAALAGAGTGATSLERFRQCGAQAVVYQHEDTGQLRLAAEFCHNRHCEPCMRAKANLLAANLREKLKDAGPRQYRFITLTLKHEDTPLLDQIKRLYACFTKLRASKLWKGSTKGGATILEVKYNHEKGEWHPHLHIIADGKFMSQKELSDKWFAITGDTFMVDIKILKTAHDASHYVAKYVSKGTNDSVWKDPAVAIEWVVATRGVRTCATFGNWRGFKLLEHPETDEAWHPLCTLNTLIDQARAGSLHHQLLWQALVEMCKYDPHKSRRKTPDIPPIDTQ